MKVNIRSDRVEIEGYVNAIERVSKPLMSRIGRFIERICKGAFAKALKRNDDVHILLNHDWDRDLGSTKSGNLELKEDAIGLHARATITDPEVIEEAKRGDLVGWSFGFNDREVENSVQDGLPLRAVRDLDLYEVSLLDRRKSPAYEGTLVSVRADESVQFFGEAMIPEEIETREETEAQTEESAETETEAEAKETEEAGSEEDVPKQQETVVDYSKYEEMIKEMKGEK